MNILIVGSGGREHAFAKLLNYEKYNNDIFVYGENLNYGLKRISRNYHIGSLSNFNKIDDVIKNNNIELVFIGPEKPIGDGLVNYLVNIHPNLKCFAPTINNARIESSKIFARNLMRDYDLNMYAPNYRVITSSQFFNDNIDDINSYLIGCINHFDGRCVIKPDGLTGGKGVKLVPEDFKDEKEILDYIYQILDLKIEGNLCKDFNRSCSLLIEEKLEGEEFSIFTVTDGINCIHSPPFQDFKKLHGISGPMTGGMGCQSFGTDVPPFLDSIDDITTAQNINKKVIDSLLNYNYNQGNIEPYKGVLYGSFMKVKNKFCIRNPNNIYVIEFNCRFGDPETINLTNVIDPEKTNINNILISASTSKDSVVHNIPGELLTQYNLDKYLYSNKKLFKLNNYNWHFKNEYSLSKYLVDKDYPYKNGESRNVELCISKEIYWLQNNKVICANIDSDLIRDKITCGKSRSFSIVVTQSEDKKNMKALEKQLNVFLDRISQNRFYYIKNMV